MHIFCLTFTLQARDFHVAIVDEGGCPESTIIASKWRVNNPIVLLELEIKIDFKPFC